MATLTNRQILLAGAAGNEILAFVGQKPPDGDARVDNVTDHAALLRALFLRLMNPKAHLFESLNARVLVMSSQMELNVTMIQRIIANQAPLDRVSMLGQNFAVFCISDLYKKVFVNRQTATKEEVIAAYNEWRPKFHTHWGDK